MRVIIRSRTLHLGQLTARMMKERPRDRGGRYLPLTSVEVSGLQSSEKVAEAYGLSHATLERSKAIAKSSLPYEVKEMVDKGKVQGTSNYERKNC